jgi:predicted  nucleic acid-binding Zn-ribbon protein
MLAHLEDLLAIQDQDIRIHQLHQELARNPKEQEGARHRLQTLLDTVAAAKTSVKENEVAIKGVELEVKTRKETILRLKNQQFETKKNEEYTTLGKEVIRYEGDVDALETKELELMEKSDELRLVLAGAEKALSGVQIGVEEEIKALQARADVSQTELEALESSRTAAMTEIPDTLSPQYERLLKSRGAPVVSAVSSDGMCSGCHVKVTPSVFVNVRNAKEPISCENCGRILYYE